jgi:hypothetical protein
MAPKAQGLTGGMHELPVPVQDASGGHLQHTPLPIRKQGPR